MKNPSSSHSRVALLFFLLVATAALAVVELFARTEYGPGSLKFVAELNAVLSSKEDKKNVEKVKSEYYWDWDGAYYLLDPLPSDAVLAPEEQCLGDKAAEFGKIYKKKPTLDIRCDTLGQRVHILETKIGGEEESIRSIESRIKVFGETAAEISKSSDGAFSGYAIPVGEDERRNIAGANLQAYCVVTETPEGKAKSQKAAGILNKTYDGMQVYNGFPPRLEKVIADAKKAISEWMTEENEAKKFFKKVALLGDAGSLKSNFGAASLGALERAGLKNNALLERFGMQVSVSPSSAAECPKTKAPKVVRVVGGMNECFTLGDLKKDVLGDLSEKIKTLKSRAAAHARAKAALEQALRSLVSGNTCGIYSPRVPAGGEAPPAGQVTPPSSAVERRSILGIILAPFLEVVEEKE